MAITSAICSSFKQELLQGKHNFSSSSGDSFKIALFDSSATLGASTTAFTDFSDVSWTSASFTANGALIYNTTTGTDTSTTDAVCAIAFGSDKTATSGTFTIQFPANDSSNAIIRLA